METHAQKVDGIALHYPTVKKLLVDFLKDEITNAGFSKGIIGLSGGVDSALAAALAVEALGKENLLAVKLPYKTSNPASVADADAMIKLLGIRSATVDITPMVQPYIDGGKIADKTRKGNIMARERMIVLYDLSAVESALVIGTSNKTEMLLGYGTQFGDLACAVNPLGDLYKTQIWQLAEFMGLPKQIIEKKPTADLWEGQTDEDELGFSYKQVDLLLYNLIDERRNDEDMIEMGFEKYFIEKV
ncbi:MAG TPA: NAD+ synthase, partial [Bacteroidota bacterium]|nr:NAD+ synthase [Bacteroidota bacterium]